MIALSGVASVAALAGCGGEGPGEEEDPEADDGVEPAGEESTGEEDPEAEDVGGEETYSLSVTVEDDAGDPVEGVSVTVEEASEAGTEGVNESDSGDNETADAASENGELQAQDDETDENGEVEFDGLGDGNYTVAAEHEDAEAEDEVTIQGADEEVTLTLSEDDGGGDDGNETDE